MDVAAAEAVRAVQRGADRGDAAVLLGVIFARRGLHGEALDRYREAGALAPQRADALLGEVKALFALGGARAEEAHELAEQLLALTPDDVEALVAVAKGRAAVGDAAGALTVLQQAQARAPARADLRKLQGDVALKIGEDRKSTRLNSSHSQISYAVFCLKKKKKKRTNHMACSSKRQPPTTPHNVGRT